MKIVFAGTPDFAVPSLLAAASRGEVAAVYTQPDRPAGRGRGLTASPVKREATRLGISVLQPESLKGELMSDVMRQIAPDLIVVVAYGLILPRAILAIPRQSASSLASILACEPKLSLRSSACDRPATAGQKPATSSLRGVDRP